MIGRRLPDCALCGGRLCGAQVRVRFGTLPGAPEVGWHADTDTADRRRGDLLQCAWEDPLFPDTARFGARSRDKAEANIRAIYARGPNRVSATRRWAEYVASNEES